MMSLQFLSPMHPDDDVYTFSHSTSRLFFLSSFDDLYMLKTRVIKLLFRFFFFEGGGEKKVFSLGCACCCCAKWQERSEARVLLVGADKRLYNYLYTYLNPKYQNTKPSFSLSLSLSLSLSRGKKRKIFLFKSSLFFSLSLLSLIHI